MSGEMEYKGYLGSAEFSAEDEVFQGKLVGIRDLVTYQTTTAAELKTSFHDAVDDYIRTCQENGRKPDVPFKGTFNVRVGRSLRKRAAMAAAQRKTKLNAIVSEALERYLDLGATGD